MAVARLMRFKEHPLTPHLPSSSRHASSVTLKVIPFFGSNPIRHMTGSGSFERDSGLAAFQLGIGSNGRIVWTMKSASTSKVPRHC
jgi:hypothetical protein